MRVASFLRESFIAACFAFGTWLIGAALTSTVFWIASPRLAYAVQVILAPPLAVAMSIVYFRRRDAHNPLVAAAIVGAVALLSTLALDDLFGRRAEGILGAVISTWIPVALLTITTFMVGLGASQPPRISGSVEDSS